MQFERLGPYKIGKRLGRGGMGAVFVGVNVDTGESAAVKLLNPHLNDDAGFRERFEMEIEALKKLQHPNIVRMYGYGEHEGQLYYVMELVTGRSVEEEIQAGRRFTWREVVHGGVKLCKALRHAHDHGIVHRDLKPANILLTETEDVKLTDFGIARLFGNTRVTMEGGLVGTAEFMSPEQAAGDRVTPLSDLYSLGGVMFAMLAGRPPFRTTSLGEMLQKQRFEPPPPVSRFNPEVPAEVEEAITRLLSKDPQARGPNALVISRQLAAMEHGLSLVLGRSPAEKTQVEGSGGAVDLVAEEPSEPDDPLAPTQIVKSFSAPAAPARSKDPTVAAAGMPPEGAVERSGGNSVVNGDADVDPEFAVEHTPDIAKTTTVENRFTTVEEDQRRREELARTSQEGPAIAQIMLLGLMLLGIVGLLWYFMQPLSANKLYSRIAAAAEDGDPSALVAAQDDVHSFLERFPDDTRAADVKRYRDEIDLQRLEQQFRIRARFPGHDDQLTPVEHDYLEAISYEGRDPQKAIDKLQALVELYAPQANTLEHTALCIELAKRQLQRLNLELTKTVAQRLEVIAASLQRADQVRKTSPQQARAIWQSIVELYSDKLWAAEGVAKARAALAETKP